IMVKKRKALVRMRSRYSRFAMSQTLCIDLASNFLYEYLFERRFLHLEAVDACTALDSIGKQRLGVGSNSINGAKLDLGAAAVGLGFLDGGMLKKAGVAFKEHLNAVARVMRFDVAHGAGEDKVSIVNERDGVTELFD